MIFNNKLYIPEVLKSAINGSNLSLYFKNIKASELIKYEQGIIAQMNISANNSRYSPYNILDCIQILCFDDKDRFSNASTPIFNILKCMANRFIYRFKADEDILDSTFCIFLSLLTKDNYMNLIDCLGPKDTGEYEEVAEEKIQKFIYKMETEFAVSIGDVYYPMYEPRKFIETVMTANLDRPIPSRFDRNVRSTTRRCTVPFVEELVNFDFTKYDETEQGHPVLFKYILDVLSNDDTKLDYMKKMVLEVSIANNIHSKMSDKISMFEKYFKDKDQTDNVFSGLIIALRTDVTYRDYYMSKVLELVVEEMLGRTPPVPINVVQNFVDSAIDIVMEISSEPILTADMIAQYHELLSNTINKYALRQSSEKALINNANSPGNISESAMECFFGSTDISDTLEGMQYTEADGFLYAAEAYKKSSKKLANAEGKIYKAFKKYKNAEDKVDSQVSKFTKAAKTLLVGDTKTEIIEGKKFSVMSLLKSALGSAALFAFGPIKGLIALVVKYTYKKHVTASERKKILIELEGELEILNEKIEDARGDSNRQAKYAMMRTRTELQNAIRRIRLGVEADNRSIQTAKNTINKIRGGR